MNIHGAHSYWTQGALGVYGLELGRSVRRRGADAYCGGLAHSLFWDVQP